MFRQFGRWEGRFPHIRVWEFPHVYVYRGSPIYIYGGPPTYVWGFPHTRLPHIRLMWFPCLGFFLTSLLSPSSLFVSLSHYHDYCILNQWEGGGGRGGRDVHVKEINKTPHLTSKPKSTALGSTTMITVLKQWEVGRGLPWKEGKKWGEREKGFLGKLVVAFFGATVRMVSNICGWWFLLHKHLILLQFYQQERVLFHH